MKKENLRNEKAILFGIGRKYRKYKEELQEMYNIVALCDNDENKQKTVIDGLPVFHPDHVHWEDYSVVVIVPGIYMGEGIFKQLLSYGVAIEKIDQFKEGWSVSLCEYYIDKDSGIKIYVDSLCDLQVFQEVFLYKEYEVGVNCSNLVCIDIGMNVGCASLYFASLPNVKKVYGFELLESTYKKAMYNFSRNEALAPKIIAENIGLSNRNGTVEVNCSAIVGNASLFFKEGDLKETAYIKDAAQVVSAILAECADDSKILLKVDTEGSEYDIFESLSKAGLLKKIDIIIGEWHNIYIENKRFDEINEIQKPLVNRLHSYFTDNGFIFKITNTHTGLGYFYAFNSKRLCK